MTRFCLLTGLILLSQEAAAEKVDKAKEAIRGSPGSGGNDGRGSTGVAHPNESVEEGPPIATSSPNYGWVAIGGLYCITIGLPFCGPHWALEGPIFIDRKPNKGFFLAYPYWRDGDGHMIVATAKKRYPRWTIPRAEPSSSYAHEIEPAIEAEEEILQPPGTTNVSANLSLEYSYDFDGVHRPSFYGRLDTTSRFGLETGWNVLIEPLPDKGRTDVLTLGKLDATYRFAHGDRTEFRAGIGGHIALDNDGFEGAGALFVYSFDIFPVNPLVFSFSADLGNLGMTFYAHGFASAGLSFQGWEPYLKYDLICIYPVIFHGPALGLRRWF